VSQSQTTQAEHVDAGAPASAETTDLSPDLKDFIAHAIVPILIQRYIARQKRTPAPETEAKG
jgi:hypothetical protein